MASLNKFRSKNVLKAILQDLKKSISPESDEHVDTMFMSLRAV
jgi:hypothetical protein